MAKVRYRPDLKGTREVMRSPAMQRMVGAAAEKGKAFVEANAPRDSGAYVRSLRVDVEVGRTRAHAVLVADIGYATAVELVNHGGERLLGRAVDVIERGP